MKTTKFTYADKNTADKLIKDSSGRRYAKMLDGSIVRMSPIKPWKGKSQRRAVLAQRRSGHCPATYI